MKLRARFGLLVLGCGAVLAACGGGGSTGKIIAPATPSPTPARSGITVLALGDDGIVAIGSVACGLAATPCATTTAAPGSPLALPSGGNVNGYTQIFGRALALSHSSQSCAFAGLGVRGALGGTAPLPEASASGDFLANPDQLPSIPGQVSSAQSRANFVVLIVAGGTNDVLDAYETASCRAAGGTVVGGGGATLAAPCTASGTTLADSAGDVRKGTLYAAYRTILTTVKAALPDAAVVVGVPDLGRFPAYASAASSVRSALTADAVLANAAIAAALADVAPANTLSFSTADAVGAPIFSAPANFAADGFHLNDTGYAALAGAFGAAFSARFVNF